jgi:UDP-glucose 4-epimerase
MRLLITGGAGFIGSNLVRLALAEGEEVVVLDDLSTGDRQNLEGLRVNFVQGSVVDERAVRQAIAGVDRVVHLAALGSVSRSVENPMASHAANATGTLTLLEEARRANVVHFVAASSSSVYGMNSAIPKGEREWVRPMSPYAVTKLATEQYVLAYQQSFGLSTLAFRLFNVYGPGQTAGHAYAAVVPSFISALRAGQPLLVHGDGAQSRDFTYVGTVVRVLLDAASRKVCHPEPVNLAFGTNTTIDQLIRVITEVSGMKPRVTYGPPRPGDVRHSQADNAVLRSLFPNVEAVSLQQGLRETLEWFEAAA